MSQKIDVFHTIAITARIILAKSFSYFFARSGALRNEKLMAPPV